MNDINIIVPPSPFIDNRKEMEDSQNEIFVNYSNFRFWTSQKNCLIQGSRGSGKTSILTVFHYKTRWFNSKIIKPSKEHKLFFPERPDIIGVNYKCEELEKSLWNSWYTKYAENAENYYLESVFASYLIYYFLDNIVKAIIDIRTEFNWTRNDEDDISLLIEEIFQTCYRVKVKRPTLYDHSLISLRNQLQETHSSIREQINSYISPKTIYENFYFPAVSSELFVSVCQLIKDNIKEFKNIKFFLMIDDINRLDQWQIRVVNTFISSSNEPCSFKMTCTGDYLTTTNLNERPISTTDLHISKLNDESETANKLANQQIDDLFTAIFNTRIERYFKNANYDLRVLFGEKIDINNQLVDALKTSIKPIVKELLIDFESSKHDKFTDYWLESNKILQLYSDKDKKKYVQYKVSAVFSILNNFNIEKSFIYYSYDMIKMISSGSPRHFLRICDRMWNNIFSSISGNNFPLKKEIQSEAIVLASEDVFQNIENDFFDKNINTSSRIMCERLANLFKEMIKIDSLRITPECLSIQLDESKFNKSDRETYTKIIDWLLMIEAIKTRRISVDVNKIALNPMLAPKFSLPYRSPFSYSYSLAEPTIFLRLLTADINVANELITTIYNNRIKNDQSLKLF